MSDVLDRLQQELGDRVRTDRAVLDGHRHDSWVLSELHDLEGRGAPRPRLVVEAESTSDVSHTLAICREARTRVVTFGGGSGVCGAIRAEADDVVLSTRNLTGMVELDGLNLTASFRAGTLGMDAERAVQKQGLTIGHWPQSIELASVGGLVATRSAGQFSTGYGNVEDLLLDLEVVLPDGSVLRTRRTPRASAGPDLRQLFLGSEGTLGVITEATFSLRPLPETREVQAFHFASMAEGLDAIRTALREGWRPPVVRLYDALESGRNFPGEAPEGRLLLLLVHEGARALVDTERAEVARLAKAQGGMEANPAVVEGWLERRNHVPGFDVFLEQGIIVDTIEVAGTWDRALALYERAVASLQDVEGMISASAHTSHSYRSGTNLYFTFLARPPDPATMEPTYLDCWRRVIDAAVAEGGGIAHHHGIGRIRAERLVDEIGPAGVDLLRSVKRAVDPDDLLNPGVLLPAAET